MRAAIDLRGQRFGRLLVVKRVGTHAGNAIWRCQCTCSRFKNVLAHHLRAGTTKSCGCLLVENGRAHALTLSTHGAAGHGRGCRWPEYNTWTGIKARCLNPKNSHYKYYGARGITVCKRWIDSFENFQINKIGKVWIKAIHKGGRLLRKMAEDGERHSGHGDQIAGSRGATPLPKLGRA